jgi:hypothetical protein
MSLREQYDSGSPCRRAARRHWSVAPGNGCGEHQGQQAHDDMGSWTPEYGAKLLAAEGPLIRASRFLHDHA